MARILLALGLVCGSLSTARAGVIDTGAVLKLQDADIHAPYGSLEFEVLTDFLDQECEWLGDVGDTTWFLHADALLIIEFERDGVSVEARTMWSR